MIEQLKAILEAEERRALKLYFARKDDPEQKDSATYNQGQYIAYSNVLSLIKFLGE